MKPAPDISEEYAAATYREYLRRRGKLPELETRQAALTLPPVAELRAITAKTLANRRRPRDLTRRRKL